MQPYGNAIPTPNIQWLADQGVMFRNAFCAAPSCSGSRAALLTGSYCHNNGMMGLAHRGFSLHDYDQHIVHTLSEAGYHCELIGEQHVSVDPSILGYDVVHDVADTNVSSVAPAAIETLSGGIPEPFFLSVGFFETHRSFFAPSSVRDRVYSLPPPFLPDTPEIRQDVAAYKASARSLDQGIGSVLNALHETGLDRNTLVICTTDHGLAFPTAKASLLDRGIGVMLIMRGPGMPPGVAHDELVSQIDMFPTVCEVAGIDPPPWLAGRSLVATRRRRRTARHALARSSPSSPITPPTNPSGRSAPSASSTSGALTTIPFPVLPNCDDSPSKEAYLARGWAQRAVARESLHDLFFNPGEGRNLIGVADYAPIASELRSDSRLGCRTPTIRCWTARSRPRRGRGSTRLTSSQLSDTDLRSSLASSLTVAPASQGLAQALGQATLGLLTGAPQAKRQQRIEQPSRTVEADVGVIGDPGSGPGRLDGDRVPRLQQVGGAAQRHPARRVQADDAVLELELERSGRVEDQLEAAADAGVARRQPAGARATGVPLRRVLKRQQVREHLGRRMLAIDGSRVSGHSSPYPAPAP